MIDVGILKQTFHSLLLSISDKNLTKMIIADQTDKLHHALVIEFVENVVKQQNGFVADFLVVELKLCQAD